MGKKKKPNGPGRKPLPPGEKRERTKPLYILLNADERDLIKDAADNAEKPASTWARELLLRAAKRTK